MLSDLANHQCTKLYYGIKQGVEATSYINYS